MMAPEQRVKAPAAVSIIVTSQKTQTHTTHRSVVACIARPFEHIYDIYKRTQARTYHIFSVVCVSKSRACSTRAANTGTSARCVCLCTLFKQDQITGHATHLRYARRSLSEHTPNARTVEQVHCDPRCVACVLGRHAARFSLGREAKIKRRHAP